MPSEVEWEYVALAGALARNLRIAERYPYAANHRDDSMGIRVARDP